MSAMEIAQASATTSGGTLSPMVSCCGAARRAPMTAEPCLSSSMRTRPAISSNTIVSPPSGRPWHWASCARTKAVPILGWPANGISARGVKMRTCAVCAAALGGRTNVVSARLNSAATACICRDDSSAASTTTARGLPPNCRSVNTSTVMNFSRKGMPPHDDVAAAVSMAVNVARFARQGEACGTVELRQQLLGRGEADRRIGFPARAQQARTIDEEFARAIAAAVEESIGGGSFGPGGGDEIGQRRRGFGPGRGLGVGRYGEEAQPGMGEAALGGGERREARQRAGQAIEHEQHRLMLAGGVQALLVASLLEDEIGRRRRRRWRHQRRQDVGLHAGGAGADEGDDLPALALAERAGKAGHGAAAAPLADPPIEIALAM